MRRVLSVCDYCYQQVVYGTDLRLCVFLGSSVCVFPLTVCEGGGGGSHGGLLWRPGSDKDRHS